VAVNYHLVVVNYHLVAVNYHLVAVNYHLVAVTYHLVAVNYQLVAVNYNLVAVNYLLSGGELTPEAWTCETGRKKQTVTDTIGFYQKLKVLFNEKDWGGRGGGLQLRKKPGQMLLR
jgi:hypothetical protein